MTRIAVVSDVHGNADALLAVMADIEAQSPDLVVNLGDCFSGPLDVAQTGDLMIAAAWPTVRGNHDRMLIDPPDPMPEWDSDALAGLAKRHLDWIRTLPVTMRIDGVFLCHATPHDDATRWLNRLDAQGHVLQRPLAEITRLAEEVGEGLIFCGHSHVAEAVPLGDGRLIVNPGSVGCPGFINDDPGLSRVVTGTPHARYAIVDSTPRGWAVSFRAIPYDTAPAIALARRRGRTEWVEVLGTGWIG